VSLVILHDGDLHHSVRCGAQKQGLQGGGACGSSRAQARSARVPLVSVPQMEAVDAFRAAHEAVGAHCANAMRTPLGAALSSTRPQDTADISRPGLLTSSSAGDWHAGRVLTCFTYMVGGWSWRCARHKGPTKCAELLGAPALCAACYGVARALRQVRGWQADTTPPVFMPRLTAFTPRVAAGAWASPGEARRKARVAQQCKGLSRAVARQVERPRCQQPWQQLPRR
jgi:hypothetical protein